MGLGTHDSHENSQNSKNSGAHKDSDDALAKAQAVSQDAAGLNGCQTKTRTDQTAPWLTRTYAPSQVPALPHSR